MNPNPTGYPALQQHGNPMLSSPAAYPVQASSPGNQQQLAFYPNPMSSYPQPRTPQGPHHPLQQHQPQSQHSFNPMPVQSSGPGAAMMPASMPQQHPGPHASLPLSAPSPYAPATIPTTTAASPSHSEPSTLPTTAVMATSQSMTAPSNSNNMFPAQQRPLQPSNQPPQAAGPSVAAQSQAAAREKARISTLLDINSALLQEVINLQAAGKAGVPPAPPGSHQNSPTQEQQAASPVSSTDQNHTNDASKPPAQKPSQEYIECMRRLQANLAYLATIADRAKKSAGVIPAAPAILTPPPNLPSLNEMYAKLNELFPGAPRGPPTTQQQQQQQQQQQRPAQQGSIPGNGGPSPVAVGDNGV